MLMSTTNFIIQANNVDPDKTAPWEVCSGSTVFAAEAFYMDKQMTVSCDYQLILRTCKSCVGPQSWLKLITAPCLNNSISCSSYWRPQQPLRKIASFSTASRLGSHRLEKYLNLEGFLEKFLKIKSALKYWKITLKPWKVLEFYYFL